MPTAVQCDVVSKSISPREPSPLKSQGSERFSFDDVLQTAGPQRSEKPSAKPDHPAKKSDKSTTKSSDKAKRADRKQRQETGKSTDEPEINAQKESSDQEVSAELSAEPVAQDDAEATQAYESKANVDDKPDDRVATDEGVVAGSASAQQVEHSPDSVKREKDQADAPVKAAAKQASDAGKSATTAARPIVSEAADDTEVAVESATSPNAPADAAAVRTASQSAKHAIKLTNFGKSIPSDADASATQAIDRAAPDDVAVAVAAAANISGNLPDQSSGFSADSDGNSDRDARTVPITKILSTLDASSDVSQTAAQSKVTPSQQFIAPRIEAPAPPPAPDAQFAADNHPRIITGIHGQLLPNGGTMQLRLDSTLR